LDGPWKLASQKVNLREAMAEIFGFEKGINRETEPTLQLRPID